MAAGFSVTRVFLVCLLSKVVDSSASSQAGIAPDHKPWQGGKPTQQLKVYGHRRPLQYIADLREAYRDKQGQSQQKPKENSGRLPSPAQIQSQFDPRIQILNPYWQQFNAAAKRAQENKSAVNPRGFLLNLEIPLLSSLIPKIDVSSKSKTSHLDGGGEKADGDRQDNIGIHSSFSLPLISTNAAKQENTNGKPKPSFNFNMVVPIQPEATPGKVVPYGEGQKQGHSGLIQSSHENPGLTHSRGTQPGSSPAAAAPKHPSKLPQRTSTLLGAQRPVLTSSGVGRPTQSGSIPFGAPSPPVDAKQEHLNKPQWEHQTLSGTHPSRVSASGGHRQIYQPVQAKPSLGSTQIKLKEPIGHLSGVAPPVHSISTQSTGRPSWGSAGGAVDATLESKSTLFPPGRIGGLQEKAKTHSPISSKKLSSSSLAGVQRHFPDSASSRRYTPVEKKPQSSSPPPGAQGLSWGSAPAAQKHVYRPVEINLESRQGPSWTSVGSRPSWSAQPYKPAQIRVQTGSNQLGIGTPFPGVSDAAKHSSVPVETKPHFGSTLHGARQPSSSSAPVWQKPVHSQAENKLQSSSIQMKNENPSGGKQVYQPSDSRLTPSEELSSQQATPVDLYEAPKRPRLFSRPVEIKVYSPQVTPPKSDSLPPIPPQSSKLKPWPSTNDNGERRGLYSVHGKPNDAGQPTGPGDSLLPVGSRAPNYHRYSLNLENKHLRPTAPPAGAPSGYRRQPFVLDKETAPSSNYNADKMVELVHKYFPHNRPPNSGSKEEATPHNRPSSGLPSSNIWSPSTGIQTGTLKEGSSALRPGGTNRFLQLSLNVGDSAHRQNGHLDQLGSKDGGYPKWTGSNVAGRLVVRPDAPASLPAASTGVDSSKEKEAPDFTHLRPNRRPEMVPGSFQPATVPIRRHNLLIV